MLARLALRPGRYQVVQAGEASPLDMRLLRKDEGQVATPTIEELRQRAARYMQLAPPSLPPLKVPPRRSSMVKEGVPTWVVGERDTGVIKMVPKDNTRAGALRCLLASGRRAEYTVGLI